MTSITEFCGIYFFIRTLIKQINQVFNLSAGNLILLTVLSSLIITIVLKFQEYHSTNILFDNMLSIALLSFILQIINILFKGNKDYLILISKDSDASNLYSYWLSELDKNIWKLGLLSLLISIFLNQIKFIKL